MLDVLLACERVMAVTPAELKARDQRWPLAHKRMVAMAACLEVTDFSSAEIGRYFDGRDHTTVLHARKRAHADERLRLLLNAVVADAMKQTPILQWWIDAVPFKTKRSK
jgi:chromosomal replication initiator protein